MASQFTADSSVVFKSAELVSSRADAQLNGGDERPSEAILKVELDWLSNDSDAALALVQSLFPEGVPIDSTFYSRLSQFRFYLGFTPSAEAITTEVWVSALRTFDETDQQKVLFAFAETGHEFFEFQHGLPAIVDAIPLNPSFAAEWFVSLLIRLGNDGANGGIFGAIDRYCEITPINACALLESLEAKVRSEPHDQLTICMIGTLRTVEMNDEAHLRFSAIENSLGNNPDPACRNLVRRSWIITSWRGGINRKIVEGLLPEIPDSKELDDQFAVLCRITIAPKLDHECQDRILEWLSLHVSPKLTPLAKHNLIDAVASIAERATPASGLQSNLWTLVLAVQPIAAECVKTWFRLEQFLANILRRDPVMFAEMLGSLCEASAPEIIKVIRFGHGLKYLVSCMSARQWDDLVTKMVFSSSVSTCQIGLFFFEHLGTRAFSSSALASTTESDLLIALFAFQATPVHGEVIARFLLAILPHIEASSPEVQTEFAEELLLQCKNYPSACLDTLRQSGSPSPLVAEAIEKADAYFVGLGDKFQSPLNSMMIPALSSIARSKRRATDRKIAEGAEQGSVFAQFVKKVEMLYGDEFCSFDDGRLADPIPTKELGFEVEFPRIDEIDPEGMALRRYRALVMIEQLRKQQPSK